MRPVRPLFLTVLLICPIAAVNAQQSKQHITFDVHPDGNIKVKSSNAPPSTTIPRRPGETSGMTLFALLGYKEIQADIKLSESQQKEFAELSESVQTARRQIMKDIPDRRILRDALASVKEEEQEKALDILSDSQRERLKMLRRQLVIRNYGIKQIGGGEFRGPLQLSLDQIKDLNDEIEAEEELLFREYDRLRDAMNRRIVERVLSKKQTSTLDRMLGAPIELYQHSAPDVQK